MIIEKTVETKRVQLETILLTLIGIATEDKYSEWVVLKYIGRSLLTRPRTDDILFMVNNGLPNDSIVRKIEGYSRDNLNVHDLSSVLEIYFDKETPKVEAIIRHITVMDNIYNIDKIWSDLLELSGKTVKRYEKKLKRYSQGRIANRLEYIC